MYVDKQVAIGGGHVCMFACGYRHIEVSGKQTREGVGNDHEASLTE